MICETYSDYLVSTVSNSANYNRDGSDGLILHEQEIGLPPHFAAQVTCQKIAYLSDGLRVFGFIFTPKRRSGKMPVLIFNRAGNQEYAKIEGRTIGYLASLAAQGYVILASQYRGNDGGEGREEFGGSDLHDVLTLLPLAQSLPYVDLDRVGMLGYSRGGMMTYLAMKAGIPIRAAAVVGAPSDLLQSYQERPDLRQILEDLIGGSPDECREAYVARSSYYWPEKLTSPLLILHSDTDWRVSLNQSKKLVEKLRTLGHAHRFRVFPNSDHNLGTHRELRNRLIFEWFARYLR